MSKKILFIHNRLVCGGAERALFSLINLLDKEKYEITVFVLNDGGEWESKFCEAGIHIIHSYSRQIEGRIIRNWLLRRRISYARAHKGKNLIHIASGRCFDLVIGYHVQAAFMDAGTELDAPKIRYIHGDARQDLVLRGNLLASHEQLKKCDCVICVSETAKQAFEEITGIKGKAIVCYNPIQSDVIKAGARVALDVAVPEKYICAVGRLSAEKGFSRLIRIHKRIIDDGIAHSLVIVGDGPERDNLLALIDELGVQKSVILTGYRSNPYCYMARSLFTVCSSFTEGLPVIGMESLCLGVPIVSAYPSVGELFDSECCGIITENDDNSLELGIRKMLADQVFYGKAKRGAQKRSKAFDTEVMIKKVEQIYDDLLDNTK